jgi:hypothetical protein
MSRDSSVSIGTGYGLDGRGSLPSFQAGSRVQPPSYPTGACTFFPGSKTAGEWNWSHTSIQYRGEECWNYTTNYPYFLMLSY